MGSAYRAYEIGSQSLMAVIIVGDGTERKHGRNNSLSKVRLRADVVALPLLSIKYKRMLCFHLG